MPTDTNGKAPTVIPLATQGVAAPQLTWNLVEDIRQVLYYPFMVNAFRAGAIVAVLSSLVGWFVVLRRQSFVGHTLAVVGFPGAAGAILIGVSAAYGLFGFAIAAALVIGLAPHSVWAQPQRGVRSHRHGAGRRTRLRVLVRHSLRRAAQRGRLDALRQLPGCHSSSRSWSCWSLPSPALCTLAVIARPLLFASVDPDVAAARGIPVRVLSIGFLVVLAAAAAAASQITGALLVFALLVIPPATAQTLTVRPGASDSDRRRTGRRDHLALLVRRLLLPLPDRIPADHNRLPRLSRCARVASHRRPGVVHRRPAPATA